MDEPTIWGVTDGLNPLELPVTRHLAPIWALLSSGANIRVTLTQDDGARIHYTLFKP